MSACWDASATRWRFRAPQGPLRVEAGGVRYESGSRTLRAGPGANEVELRLERER